MKRKEQAATVGEADNKYGDDDEDGREHGHGNGDGADELNGAAAVKKSRTASPSKTGVTTKAVVPVPTSTAVVASEQKGQLVLSGPKRTSSLLAPTMLLTGHEGYIYSVKFNSAGDRLASASFDKRVFIWNVFGDCKNIGLLQGHKGAVLHLAWSKDGRQVYTASSDKTGAVFDVEEGVRTKKLKNHTSYVNCVCASHVGEQILITASDDGNVMLWDIRARAPQKTLKTEYPLMAAAFSGDDLQVFSAGIDEAISAWDLRNEKIIYQMLGHQDSITGMELSSDGKFLLTNSMDNTIRQWDVRPYVSNPNNRFVKAYVGAQHDMQKNLLRCAWSPDSSKISAGSADGFVYVWDAASQNILYKLPGHSGSVNEVDFHPNEPIVASCGSDKKIYLGEIEPSLL